MKPPSSKESFPKLQKADTCKALKKAMQLGNLKVAALSRGQYPGKRLTTPEAHEIRSVGFWDARHAQQWGLDWHSNEGIEIGYLESGSLDFEAEDHAEALTPGALTITRPWQRHRIGRPFVQASRYHWLILDVGVSQSNMKWQWPSWILLQSNQRAELTRFLRQNEHPVWHANSGVARAFRELGKSVVKTNGQSDMTLIQLAINGLLLSLLELMRKESPSLDASLSTSERAIQIFLKDLKRRLGEPWTLQRMASESGLGRSRFSAYCKQITNCTPVQYLNQCRISAAAKLLASNDFLSITEVAMQCGFQSSQYFATVTRNIAGMAPSALRGGHVLHRSRRRKLHL